MALRDQVCELLQQSFPDGEVSVEEWGGAGDHLAARVRSSRFAGLALRRQHELVYEPVRHLIDDGSIHALKIKTEAKP